MKKKIKSYPFIKISIHNHNQNPIIPYPSTPMSFHPQTTKLNPLNPKLPHENLSLKNPEPSTQM